MSPLLINYYFNALYDFVFFQPPKISDSQKFDNIFYILFTPSIVKVPSTHFFLYSFAVDYPNFVLTILFLYKICYTAAN
jgi:hypothetical protein